MPTKPRLSGELFIIALEVTSLWLQRDDYGLARKLEELSEYELKIIRHQLACLTCYLRNRDVQEHVV